MVIGRIINLFKPRVINIYMGENSTIQKVEGDKVYVKKKNEIQKEFVRRNKKEEKIVNIKGAKNPEDIKSDIEI